MTPISINIPHKLGKAEARRRLETGFVKMREQVAGAAVMKFQESWEADRLTFSARGLGQTLRGRMDVLDDAIRIEIDLPDFLVSMADAIKGRLQRQGALLLEDKTKKP